MIKTTRVITKIKEAAAKNGGKSTER